MRHKPKVPRKPQARTVDELLAKTVSDFLLTDYALELAESLNESVNSFYADGGGRICREFRGYYSVSEVRFILKNLEAMQRACDHWRGLTSNINETLESTH